MTAGIRTWRARSRRAYKACFRPPARRTVERIVELSTVRRSSGPLRVRTSSRGPYERILVVLDRLWTGHLTRSFSALQGASIPGRCGPPSRVDHPAEPLSRRLVLPAESHPRAPAPSTRTGGRHSTVGWRAASTAPTERRRHTATAVRQRRTSTRSTRMARQCTRTDQCYRLCSGARAWPRRGARGPSFRDQRTTRRLP